MLQYDWSSTRSQNVHFSPLLRSLLWLPVAARTEYKTLMLAFKALKGMAPPYLQSLIEPYNPRCALRSANTGMLTEPSLKTAGQRSTCPILFALLAPKLWNKLPVALRTTDSLSKFLRKLCIMMMTLLIGLNCKLSTWIRWGVSLALKHPLSNWCSTDMWRGYVWLYPCIKVIERL